MARRDIVVVGGSAGSGAVIEALLTALPGDFPASIAVVTHIGTAGAPNIVERLNSLSGLRVAIAADGQPIESGHAYFPPADHHLLLFPGVIRLGRGPRENMARPAIDPLFRSAALAYGARVIGVVLSGYLNDGASGLFAIKRRGGMAVVQQPLDAEIAHMPQAALEAVDADRVVRAHDLAPLLAGLVREAAPPDIASSQDLELEVAIAMGRVSGSSELRTLAEPSPLSCPNCQGVLSEVRGQAPLRYRCQTGHAYTADAIHAAQQPKVDEALMIALRVMEERVTLVERMGREAREQGRTGAAELYESRGEEYSGYADTLRQAAVRSLPPRADLETA